MLRLIVKLTWTWVFLFLVPFIVPSIAVSRTPGVRPRQDTVNNQVAPASSDSRRECASECSRYFPRDPGQIQTCISNCLAFSGNRIAPLRLISEVREQCEGCTADFMFKIARSTSSCPDGPRALVEKVKSEHSYELSQAQAKAICQKYQEVEAQTAPKSAPPAQNPPRTSPTAI